jgi:LSD1 subclass zinc finger protein
MYGEYLRASGLEVEEVSDGRLALAKAIARRPAIIVTDTRLTGISGYELCQLIRRDATLTDTPIVVVTGDAFPSARDRERAAVADLVLLKPCLPSVLLAEMQQLISRSRELTPRPDRASKLSNRLPPSRTLRAGVATKRRSRERAFDQLAAAAPELVPPSMICPSCRQPLRYQRSHRGGVSVRQREQWDYYECPTGCGTFQYRQRTRKLRNVS